jgi:lysozyme inhibitor LprI
MSRPILVSITGAVVAALFAGAAQAQPTAPDTGAIKACLKRQEAALGHACIGIVADPCIDAAGGDTAKRKACAERERAVWQAELEAALRGVRKGGFKEIIESVTQAQKSWESSLRTLCPIFGKIEPGTLPGDDATCTMVETASRALLLRRLAWAVNEH